MSKYKRSEINAVIGLGFGDEGKGLVTDYICSKHPDSTIVYRHSGGHQCGHTVIRKVRGKDIKHVFASFGSGTLLGCPTYWSKFCTFEPIGFIEECKLLRSYGIDPVIYVHPDCSVTTPFDIHMNRLGEEIRHGTTGVGFFKTIGRSRLLKLTVAELFNPVVLKMKLECIRAYYKIARTSSVCLNDFSNCIEMLKDVIKVEEYPPEYEHVVFEGNQGLLLDQDSGFYPHVTPSSIGLSNIGKLGFMRIDDVYLVTRAYQTRHGNGPMTNSDIDIKLKNNKTETNQPNSYQGNFRIGALDLDLIEYGIDNILMKDTKIGGFIMNVISKNIMVTCLDQVNDNFIFTHKGKARRFKNNKHKFTESIYKALSINGLLYECSGPCARNIKEH